MINTIVNEKKSLQDYLYTRGFLITNNEISNIKNYPFFNNWFHVNKGFFNFYVHNKQKLFFYEINDVVFFIIGHAYNPFTMEHNENQILKELSNAYLRSYENYLDKINELTGVFILGTINENTIDFMLDCSGMQYSCYGLINDKLSICSHTALLGDLYNLTPTSYVNRLLKYKFYKLYGNFLPGDITPYENLKRVIPNTLVRFIDNKLKIERIYPKKRLECINTQDGYKKQIQIISDILHANLELISKKWKKPAISLTGGMDSKTTLACANGIYDKFNYFSYISIHGESIDANAAKDICNKLGLTHKIYNISNDNSTFDDFENVKLVMKNNIGNIGNNNSNDIRKRIFFMDNNDFDVEIKSWVSEIARANYYKKFGLSKMPAFIKPRYLTTLYKVFLHNRKLVRETDVVFDTYLKKTNLAEKIFNYDWSDLFLWEIRYGAWGGLVLTSEHRVSYDITIPYNNRKLLDLFLALPLKDRIADKVHEDIICYMNHEIHDTKINVVNYNETKVRMIVEKIYFYINRLLP